MKTNIRIFFLFISGFLVNEIRAQDYAQKLEDIKTRYLVIVNDSLQLISEEKKTENNNRWGNELMNPLEDIIQHGNGQQINEAKYFKILAAQWVYQAISENDLEKRISYSLNFINDYEFVLSYTSFPISLTQNGTKYTINRDKFISRYIYFYKFNLSYNYYNSANYKKAIEYAKILINSNVMNPVEKCGMYNFINLIYYKSKEINAEKYDMIYNEMDMIFNQLGSDRAGYIEDHPIKPYNLASTYLYRVVDLKSYKNKSEYAGKIAGFMQNVSPRSDVVILGLYKMAIEEGKYKAEAYAYCLDHVNKGNYFTPKEEANEALWKKDLKETGIKLLIELAPSRDLGNCEEVLKIAEEFTLFGDNENAKKYKDKYEACLKEVEKKMQKMEREKRRANNFNNYYLGIYPLELLKIGLEGHLDIRNQNYIHSFSYGLIGEKRDWGTQFFNKEKKGIEWEGYRFHYAFKWALGETSDKGYTGIWFGFSQKNYKLSAIQATVNGATVMYNFAATEQQFEFIGLYGLQSLGRVFGTDLSFGLGLTYNHFNGGNPIWGKKNVIIESNFLTNRKTNAIYPQVKLLWSGGFHFHRKGDLIK